MRAPSRLALWLTLAVPPLAWYGFQQGLAMTLRGSCAAAGVPLGPLWGTAGILLCIGAIWFARPDPGRPAGERFLSLLAMLGGGLFALAIFFQVLATLIIPPCAR